MQPKDFNSYGARRGNHEVMMRGTFANIRLKNLMVPGVEGGFTAHQPDGEKMTIFDASERYRKEGVPLIVIAGKEYGTGSSRDWAAKGVQLLGVRAVIAENFERIHRSNLIGMGVLALEFKPGENRQTLGLTGKELFSITGLKAGIKPRQTLKVRAEFGGKTTEFEVTMRADTPEEVEYVRHGGILPFVLRELIRVTKHIGIVAVSAEGAALCYRTICLEGSEFLGPHEHPEITLHGFSLGSYQRLIDEDRWDAVGEMMLESAAKLVQSGAQLLICPDNTVHQGLDLVRERSPAPWIHIAEEVADEARRRGFKRVGILGTRYLMEGPVYPSKLAPAGIEYRIPNVEQRERINQIIYDELVNARILPESRAYFQNVIRDLADRWLRCDRSVVHRDSAADQLRRLSAARFWTRREFSPVRPFAKHLTSDYAEEGKTHAPIACERQRRLKSSRCSGRSPAPGRDASVRGRRSQRI